MISMAMEKETHLAVFTGAALKDMLDDGRVGCAELAVARVDQPAGAVLQRVPDMLVEVAELPEHRPDERRLVPVSPGVFPEAEGGEGRDDAEDVEGHRQHGRGEHREQAQARCCREGGGQLGSHWRELPLLLPSCSD